MSDGLRLRDIDDVRAYVRKVSATIDVDPPLREDLVQEGLHLVFEKERSLPPGTSLQRAIGGRVSPKGGSWLRCRLLNWVEASSPVPSTSEEHEASSESAESAALTDLALTIFEKREDVRDPRIVARYLTEAGLYAGASHRPPGTAASEEVWAGIEAARADHTGHRPVGFRIEPDLDL